MSVQNIKSDGVAQATDGRDAPGTAPASIQDHVRSINALVTKLDQTEAKLEYAQRKIDEYRRTIGQHIVAIKKARPNDWQEVVETECKLGRSRAYELMAIADGTKTPEQVRDQTNVRKIKHRKSVRSRNGRTGDEAPTSAHEPKQEPARGVTSPAPKRIDPAIEAAIADGKAAIEKHEIADLKAENAKLKQQLTTTKNVLTKLDKMLVGLARYMGRNRQGNAKLRKITDLVETALADMRKQHEASP